VASASCLVALNSHLSGTDELRLTRVVYRVVFVIGCVSCNKFSHFRQNVTISTNRPLYPPPFSSTYLRASLRLSARPTRAPNPPRKRRASDTYFSRSLYYITALRLFSPARRKSAQPQAGKRRQARRARATPSPIAAPPVQCIRLSARRDEPRMSRLTLVRRAPRSVQNREIGYQTLNRLPDSTLVTC
jgi:hypothetical protein